jgi:chromosome segregation ATPase
MERDELKARLEETERQLKERTRRVAHLEQSLEDMTQYLLNLKAKLPSARPNLQRQACFDNDAEASEVASSNLSGS